MIKNNKILLLPFCLYYSIGPLILGIRKASLPLREYGAHERLISLSIAVFLIVIVKTLMLSSFISLYLRIKKKRRYSFRQVTSDTIILLTQNVMLLVVSLPFLAIAWYARLSMQRPVVITVIASLLFVLTPLLLVRIRTFPVNNALQSLLHSITFCRCNLRFILSLIMLTIVFQGSFWLLTLNHVGFAKNLLTLMILLVPRAFCLTLLLTLIYEYKPTHSH